MERNCTTCQYDKTGATACLLCDGSSSWKPMGKGGLWKTKQEWSKIDPVLIASEGSPTVIRQIVEEAKHDIEMLYDMISESGRGDET